MEFKIGQFTIKSEEIYNKLLKSKSTDNDALTKLDKNNNKIIDENELAEIDNDSFEEDIDKDTNSEKTKNSSNETKDDKDDKTNNTENETSGTNSGNVNDTTAAQIKSLQETYETQMNQYNKELDRYNSQKQKVYNRAVIAPTDTAYQEGMSKVSEYESKIESTEAKIQSLSSNYESQISSIINTLSGAQGTVTGNVTSTGGGTSVSGNHNWNFDFTETLTDSQKSDLEAFKKIYTENIDKYKTVEAATGVPAELIAAIHWSESGCNFDTYLHNGDPLGSPTVHVPEGIFFEKGQWAEAAIDAIKSVGMSVDPNDINSIYDYAERYNGLGYRNKGLASPYVWSGTSKYTGGKYVADGVFDPDAYDQTIGVAVMLKALST